jgi:hypothetical protein
VEDGELTIDAYGRNAFIYANGVVNGLSPHNHSGAFTLALTSHHFAIGGVDTSKGASRLNSDSSRKLWIWHGALMVISWGILAPLAIGSSILRGSLCLAPGVRLTMYFSLNMLAILCIIVSFGNYRVRHQREHSGWRRFRPLQRPKTWHNRTGDYPT